MNVLFSLQQNDVLFPGFMESHLYALVWKELLHCACSRKPQVYSVDGGPDYVYPKPAWLSCSDNTGEGLPEGKRVDLEILALLEGPSSHLNIIFDPTFLKQKKLIDIHSLIFFFLESSK